MLLCKKDEETQKHALEECEEINKQQKQVTTTMIFDEIHEINTNRENHQDTIQQTMNQQETTHQSTNHNNK